MKPFLPFWGAWGLLTVGLLACQSPVGLGSRATSTLASIVLSIREANQTAEGRTLVPTITVSPVVSYSVLVQNGSASHTVTGTTSPLSLPGLTPGTWTVVVSGFDGSGTLVAQGSSGPIAVGANQTVAATIVLSLLQNGGSGAVRLAVNFPHSVGITSVDATLAGVALTPVLSSDGTTDTATLAQTAEAGSPLVQVFLKKDGVPLAVVTESVWVFRGVTTAAAVNLAAGDFGTPPAAPTLPSAVPQQDGSMLVSWTPNSMVADAYEVRRAPASGGSWVQVGGDLAYQTTQYWDQGLAPATAYAYRITAKNRFGESAAATVTGTSLPLTAAPVFSPGPGTTLRETLDTIALSDAAPGAVLYYTTDGSAPTRYSPRYAGPVPAGGLGPSLTLKVLATAPGNADSTTPAAYTVDRKPVIASAALTGGNGLFYRINDYTTYTLRTTASDPEGTGLTCTYSVLPSSAGVSLSNSGASGGTFTTGVQISSLTAFTVQVTVADAVGNTSTVSVPVTVTNRPPVVGSVTLGANAGTLTHSGTDKTTLTVAATDPDYPESSLTYAYAVTSGPGQVYGNGATAYFVTGTTAGVSTVTVSVSDGKTATTRTVTITTQ